MSTRNMEIGNRDDNKNCFETCGVLNSNVSLMKIKEHDFEFEALVRQLSPQ